ncbi:MAG: porin family protein [Gemmatimonadetes bacterium]|nr:porin family protein [Gemmatimonadota bacterium]
MKTIRWDLLQLSAVRSVLATAALIFLVGGFPAPARAQLNEFGIGAGVAVPVSEINTRQGPGLHLLGYAGFRVNANLQFRGELALTRFNGKRYTSTEGRSDESRPDLRVASVGGTLVYTPRGTGTGVYGFVGTGMYQLSAGGESDGLVPGASVGVGTNLDVGALALFAQTRLEVPFSTFGSGTESAPNVYLPFAVGVRVPCCTARSPRS